MAAILAYAKMEKKAAEFVQGLLSRAGQLRGIKFLKMNQTPPATRLAGAEAPSRSGAGDLFRIATTDKADAGRTLQLLREKEKQFRDLYDNAPVAYFSVSAADGSIVDCNLAAQRLSGYSKKTLTGMQVFDLYADTEQGLPRAKEVFKQFKAGEPICDVELQIRNRAGKRVWVSLSVEPLRDRDGKTIRSRSILVDISARKRAEEALHRAHAGVKEQVAQRTAELAKANRHLKQEIEERKQAEAALRESENNFRALAENAQDGILIAVSADSYIYGNKRSKEITGYDPSELLKGGFEKLMHPDELPRIRERFKRRMAGKQVPERYETKIVQKGGQVVPIEVSGSKTVWKGQPGVLAIIRDIAARKQMEAELTEAHVKLEQRVEARTLELREAAGELQSKHKELLIHKKELEKVNRELVDTNKALSVLARNIDRKREEAEKKITLSISSKILPLIEGLKNDQSLKNLAADLDMLSASLKELTPGLKNGSGIIYALSSCELRVATMIKNGLTSPEIARLLHVSLDTVKTHRRNIRRKLNISNSKINLASYLRVKMG